VNLQDITIVEKEEVVRELIQPKRIRLSVPSCESSRHHHCGKRRSGSRIDQAEAQVQDGI
jgi:hypothetical protein